LLKAFKDSEATLLLGALSSDVAPMPTDMICKSDTLIISILAVAAGQSGERERRPLAV